MKPTLKNIGSQVIVLTGASSGVGLVTARKAAQLGARLVLVARSEGSLHQLAEELREHGNEVITVVADVGKHEEVGKVAQAAIERFGGFDTWINNAGVTIFGRHCDVPLEDQRRLFDTNYWGTVHGSLAAAAHLREHGGAIINMGSEAADGPLPLQSAYAASQHAIKGFTDSLRLELEQEQAPVSVTLIKPPDWKRRWRCTPRTSSMSSRACRRPCMTRRWPPTRSCLPPRTRAASSSSVRPPRRSRPRRTMRRAPSTASCAASWAARNRRTTPRGRSRITRCMAAAAACRNAAAATTRCTPVPTPPRRATRCWPLRWWWRLSRGCRGVPVAAQTLVSGAAHIGWRMGRERLSLTRMPAVAGIRPSAARRRQAARAWGLLSSPHHTEGVLMSEPQAEEGVRAPPVGEPDGARADDAGLSLAAQYRRLLDAVEDCAVFETDARGCIAMWPDAARRVFGYSAEEITGRHFSCLHRPDDVAAGLPQQWLQRPHSEAARATKAGACGATNCPPTHDNRTTAA